MLLPYITKVYASTANYLKVTVGNGLEFVSATIECPVNSLYDGPDIAPCIIDATDGVMGDISIIAPDGIPNGVYIIGISSYSNVEVICDDDGFSIYPFDTFSSCWWTNDPSTEPTIEPTGTYIYNFGM